MMTSQQGSGKAPQIEAVEGGEVRPVEPGGEVVALRRLDELIWLDRELDRSLRKWTQRILLSLFFLTNLATIGLFCFTARQRGGLSDWALGELAGMTTAEVAGLLYVSSRYLFSHREPNPKTPVKKKT
ncbi:MAG: hypothetical protein DMG65_19235 [Candidatus Angelobacter sp. Gp1-AA117]|nr:MAG: hypothetical protein DMG65_19235 [Candidatus Angelobacter sp. Gp1-AA117]